MKENNKKEVKLGGLQSGGLQSSRNCTSIEEFEKKASSGGIYSKNEGVTMEDLIKSEKSIKIDVLTGQGVMGW